MSNDDAKAESKVVHRERWGYYLLLAIPFVGVLWVPFFNAAEPSIGGVPFFYWYQFLWIAIGAALTAFVYFATRAPGPAPTATGASAAPPKTDA